MIGSGWLGWKSYRLLCRWGLHFLHDSFERDGWYCACRRNFMLNEDLYL